MGIEYNYRTKTYAQAKNFATKFKKAKGYFPEIRKEKILNGKKYNYSVVSPSGWTGESTRHSMSAYGIKTGNKKYTYFYEKPSKKQEAKGKYVVYKVPETEKDSEMQARVIAKKRGKSLAGGLFTEEAKPYNFEENYKVVNVPASTPEAKPTAHDKFIDGIIQYESGEATPEQERKLFKKLKTSGIGKKLQGHYSSRM